MNSFLLAIILLASSISSIAYASHDCDSSGTRSIRGESSIAACESISHSHAKPAGSSCSKSSPCCPQFFPEGFDIPVYNLGQNFAFPNCPTGYYDWLASKKFDEDKPKSEPSKKPTESNDGPNEYGITSQGNRILDYPSKENSADTPSSEFTEQTHGWNLEGEDPLFVNGPKVDTTGQPDCSKTTSSFELSVHCYEGPGTNGEVRDIGGEFVASSVPGREGQTVKICFGKDYLIDCTIDEIKEYHTHLKAINGKTAIQCSSGNCCGPILGNGAVNFSHPNCPVFPDTDVSYAGKDEGHVKKKLASDKKLSSNGESQQFKQIDLTAVPSEASCGELIYYRDHDLVAAWDKIISKTISKVRLNEEMLADVAKLRQELLDDNSWSTSGGVAAVQVVHLLSNTVTNVLAVASPSGRITSAFKKYAAGSSPKANKFYKSLSKGRDAMNIAIAEDAERELFDMAAGELGLLGAVYTAFNDLKKDINNFQDYSQLRKDVAEQLTNFDRATSAYQAKIDQLRPESTKQLEKLNSNKNILDGYLADNCALGSSPTTNLKN